MKPNKIIIVVFCILEVMQTYGSTVFLGENVTQLQLALQCADLAEIMTNDHEIVIAALFHDIGHLLYQAHNKDSLEIDKNYLGDPSHELTGSQFLQSVGFSERVCAIVANHVNAKRYLLSNDKKYFEQSQQLQTSSNIETVVIPKSGHRVILDQPQLLKQQIQLFLEKIPLL